VVDLILRGHGRDGGTGEVVHDEIVGLRIGEADLSMFTGPSRDTPTPPD
jgi:hypothetical protein